MNFNKAISWIIKKAEAVDFGNLFAGNIPTDMAKEIKSWIAKNIDKIDRVNKTYVFFNDGKLYTIEITTPHYKNQPKTKVRLTYKELTTEEKFEAVMNQPNSKTANRISSGH